MLVMLNKIIKFKFNKTFLYFIFIYSICCIGGTYGYFALSAEDTGSVVGIAGEASLDLDVERIIPTSGTNAMVPQLEKALGTAISNQYNCVDDNGNTVCQVYKAIVTNEGTTNVRLRGTMSFAGINNLPNLKWKRIENSTEIGYYTSHIASTSDIAFETERLLTPDESMTYYFVVWIDETGSAQTDNGTFQATIKFNSTDGGLTSTIIGTPFIDEVMKVNAVSDADIDFTQLSQISGTNGIYLRSGTENDANPIYYYRGNVNNNLIFAETCWKVVRTTETGGLKLIYNGIPSNGQCNNTGTASQIGTKAFNTNYNSPAYVGYKYSGYYEADYKVMDRITGNIVYGNDVTYSNGIYTLVNTISSNWSSLYNDGLKNNHYTCFSTGITCEHVHYIYNTDSSYASYITLTDGKNIEQALKAMLGSDDGNISNYNTISSSIKGNNTTEGTLDYWYYNNIEQKGYSHYIEDTVWCNNREIYSIDDGFNPDGGLTNLVKELDAYISFSEFWYNAELGEITEVNPKLTCSRNIDKFTTSESNGNGDLDYPVGLLTSDEILLAGAGGGFDGNNSYYLYSGVVYWSGSPIFVDNYGAMSAFVDRDGGISGNSVEVAYGVRPSVSLKPGFLLTGNGDGSGNNPYVVD